MKHEYYCEKCEEKISNSDDLEFTGVETKSINEDGKLGIGSYYRHKNCGSLVKKVNEK